jgi:predicted Zn-dependent peptidase
MKYEVYSLRNGIRVVHEEVESPVAHCGVFINAGSRDEEGSEHGLAHFIEHAIFKGTRKRNFYHILSRLENVGADLNAFTSKEETCIYASFQYAYYERSLELIADILLNSEFPEKELQKEKAVILDEINSYKDSPSDQIFDDFEEMLFAGHPLGRNILGNKKNLKLFSRAHINRFMSRNYHPSRIVIGSVGKMAFPRLVRLVEKYFSDIPYTGSFSTRNPISGYVPLQKKVNKKTFQTHCVIGNLAYGFSDPRRIPMALLTNILGGPGMNSRLNLSVREKHGLTYNIESGYTAYSDTGMFSIYLGVDNGSLDRTLGLVYKELAKLRTTKLGPLQMRTAQRQFTGQLAVGYESNPGRMLALGKNMMMAGRIHTLEEVNRVIERTTSGMILEMANEIFDPERLSSLTYVSK